MIQETRPDELGALRARVARLEATRAHPRRRSRFGALVVATLFIALAPLAVLAAPAFDDLDSAGAEHRPDIQAISGAGIATGFDDPASDDPDARLYDPKGLVTREQMASFLARTAGLGGNPPVANAARLAGGPAGATYAANDLVRAARATSAAFVTLDTTGVNMDVLALTITAPTDGFVLVVTTAYGNAIPTNPCPCELQARLTDGTLTSPPVTTTIQGSAPDNDEASVAATYVFPIAADERVITLRAQRNTGTTPLATSGTMAALFVPFGAGGVGALGQP